MYFVPLSQEESVQLLIHALRMAGGETDCGACPAAHVCMKQCLSIAAAIGRMYESGTLPRAFLDNEPEKQEGVKNTSKKGEKTGKRPGLKIIK